jgi:hypothetical protein
MKAAASACATTTANVGDEDGHVAAEACDLDRSDPPRMQHPYSPSVMQRVKSVTSHAAAYVQRWWCGAGLLGQHIYGPQRGSHAPMERDPARMSARMLIAAGCGLARVPTCENALRARIKFYHLIATENEGWFMTHRLRQDLRFDTWHDDHDVNTRALRKMWLRTARVDDFSPVLVRALSLFGPGELRALRVIDVDVFHLVTSLMRTTASINGGVSAPQIEQATEALCAVQVDGLFSSSPDIGSLAAILQRHSATITEFDAALPEAMLRDVSAAVACCTRLELLTGASHHDPAIWLGLSHLHTLCGVDLGNVSSRAITAALPNLHTLKARGYCRDPAQAADFFTDLLPRLRVFHFDGRWPDAHKEPISAFAPLPLLRELVWNLSSHIAPCDVLGAQPAVLHAPYALISKCWLSGVNAPVCFLARVCDLRIKPASQGSMLEPADVARVLRAAPLLKTFHTAHSVRDAASWLAPTAPTHRAFEGLVHPRLREFGIRTPRAGAQHTRGNTPPDAEWVAHLRRRHFPRLRELVFGDEKYFVTLPDRVSLEIGSAV